MQPSPNQNRRSEPERLDIYGGKERIAAIFNWFLYLVLALLLAGVFILLSNKNIWEAIVTCATSIAVLLAIFLVHRKKAEVAATFLALVLIVLVTLLATHGQGIHNITILTLPAILIVASLVTRKRIMALLTLACLASAAWLVFGDVYGLYSPHVVAHSVPGDFFSASLMLITTAVMVRLITESLYRSNLQLQQELRERKLAEQALALSEKKFYEAFHASPVMMTIEGADHTFVDVNQAFLDGIGCGRDEVLGRSASDLQIWASGEDVERVRNIGTENNGVKNLEMRFRRRSGEMGVVIISSDRFEVDGAPFELTSGLDITERRRMEDSLFEEKELAEVTLHSIGDAVITTNIQAQVEFLNPVAEALTGGRWRMRQAEIWSRFSTSSTRTADSLWSTQSRVV
jgi:PAS domain S-box-containing protein